MILEMLYDDKKKFYEWQPKNGEGYELTIKVKENGEFKIDKVDSKRRHYMIELTIGFILDIIIGDPNNPFHPVRGIGYIAKKFEIIFRSIIEKVFKTCRTYGLDIYSYINFYNYL